MKATEDDTKGWEDIRALRLECLLVTSKTAISTECYLEIECNPYQKPYIFFHRTGTNNPKSYAATKDPELPKQSWEKENKAGSITVPGFEVYYKASVIKRAWYWHKSRHKNQQNKIENTEINLHTYS